MIIYELKESAVIHIYENANHIKRNLPKYNKQKLRSSHPSSQMHQK